MLVTLHLEVRENDTGPWVEVEFRSDQDHCIPVTSIPVNPNYGNGDLYRTGLLMLADQLRDALVGVGQ